LESNQAHGDSRREILVDTLTRKKKNKTSFGLFTEAKFPNDPAKTDIFDKAKPTANGN